MTSSHTSRRSRKLVTALTLSLAVLAPLKPVYAQWAVSEVGPFGAMSLANWVTELAKWEAQLQAWGTAVSNVMNVANFSLSFGLTNPTLGKINDPADYAKKACPDPQGFAGAVTAVLEDINSFFNSSMTANPAQSQRKLCMVISLLKVDKYNRTVDMMNRLSGPGGINDLLKKIDALRNGLTAFKLPFVSGTTHTDLASVGEQTQRSMLKMGTEMNEYKARIKATDDAINTLEQMQSTLAKIRLNGTQTELGNIIQAGAFAAAFSN
jgi:hypothetical protein